MKLPLYIICLISLALVGPPGCDRDASLDPPAIRFGQDTCHACGMIVSDERYAAAVVVLRDGAVERYVFDDVGEMLEFTPPSAQQIRWYTRDAATRKWIDATRANYVKSNAIHTPMGSGITAYARPEDAQETARLHAGTIATFAQLRTSEK